MRASKILTIVLACVVAIAFIACGVQSDSALSGGPNVPDSEISALQDLYEATNGNDWMWFKNETKYGNQWNFTNPNPCSDRWQGVTCTSLSADSYFHVETLTLPSFNMVGTLPPSLESLSEAVMFNFMNNSLSGRIPAAFGEIRNLSCLNLGLNELTGSIPIELSGLAHLQTLYLNRNHLNGSLPTLDAASDLSVLFISENQLTGTIPSSYADLTKLTILRVGDNRLHGPIPAFLGGLTKITLFGLFQNAFTGTLPDLSGLTQLTSFVVAVNKLDGPVPAYFGRMPRLQELVLTSNYFSGEIPDELCESQTLQQLYLNINKLTGSFPTQLGSLTKLTVLRADNNYLTGTIPAGLLNAANMTILSVSHNQLVGSLPSDLGVLARLQLFDVSDNDFTGTIPSSVCDWTEMQNFTATGCHFSGSIPAAIGNMKSLQYLSLYDNLLTSTLPASLKLAEELVVLLLHNNQLTGPLVGVFNASAHQRISTIQLSENGFTGDLPADMFALPELETAILGTNCFHGELPESICDAAKLQTLSLNGLSTGAPCRKPLFPGVSDAYTTSHPIHHGIPPCLFAMETLNTLQLSGNGITGSLPGNIELGPNLLVLALSHNKLTGTIPNTIQRRIWFNLDMSSNKFKGTLNGGFATLAPVLTNSTLVHFQFRFNSTNIKERYHSTASLRLSENRLSHRVPDILTGMQNISILRGNLFGCDLDHSDLPREDGAEYTYNCGSNSFNASYTAYMCCVGAVLAVLAGLYYWRERFLTYVDILELKRTVNKWISFSHLYRDSSGQAIMRRYESVLLMADELCKVGVYCTGYILIVQLSLCSSFSRYYGTHTYEYAWSVSAAFLSGDAAASVLIVSYTALLLLVLYFFRRAMRTMSRVYAEAVRHDTIRSIHLATDDHDTSASLKKAIVFTAYLAVNISIVSLVHVGYVSAYMNGTSLYKTLAQLALSAFRLMWSTYGAQFFIRGAQRQLATSESEMWRVKDARFFAVQVLVQMLNMVVIPCLVVLVISPDCFHYAFTAAPSSTSLYFYDDCHIYGTNVGCVAPDYRIASTTFHPPFTYSYECSASWITFYAPALVYSGLFTTFVNPFVDLARRHLIIHVPRDSRLFWLVDKVVPKILRPVSAATVQYDKTYNPLRPYFDANFLLLTLASYLGLLLTFGFVFPPLAFVLLLAMYSTVYSSRLHVGRFLTDAMADNLPQYAVLIEKECLGISWRFLRCVRVLMAVMTCFFALFVFDAIGDTHGAKESFLIIITVFAIPLALWASIALYDRSQGRRDVVAGSVSDFADAAKKLGKMFNGVELSNFPEESSPAGEDVVVEVDGADAGTGKSAGTELSDNPMYNATLH